MSEERVKEYKCSHYRIILAGYGRCSWKRRKQEEEEDTHTHTLCKATHHRNRMYTVQEHRLLQKKSNNNIPKSMHSTRVCLTKTLCHLSYFETIGDSNLCQRKTFTNHWRLKINLLNSWWSYSSTDNQVTKENTQCQCICPTIHETEFGWVEVSILQI